MSAAAPATCVETAACIQAAAVDPTARKAIQEVVHELRQPLSSIEAIAYYVEMTLPPELLQARQYMRRLQELVAQAESVLETSALAVRKPPASSTNAGAS